MKMNYTTKGDRLMPMLGLGTWKSAPGEVGAAVELAINLGYRHIDCAAIYGNEAEIGEAIAKCIAAGTVTREDLWITSKLWNDCHAPEHVGPALAKTLADLQLDYLDLYLIHWPVCHRHGVVFPKRGEDFISLRDLPPSKTWTALEQCVAEGRTKFIGVSNFSAKKLGELLEHAKVKPAVNQVELHPYLQQQELLEYAQAYTVHLTAYSPLGSLDRPDVFRSEDDPILLEDPVIREVAAQRGCTPAQVLIAWALARKTSVIPKSTNPKRLAENLAAAEVELTDADMQAIAGLERGRRYLGAEFWVREGNDYTAANIYDE